jgi:phosphopantothenoylcysteine decarboxylase/phosphopantothenate--cysteine ligase
LTARCHKKEWALADERALFVCVTAAGIVRDAGEIVRGALAVGWEVYGVATPNVASIISPRKLFAIPGCTWVRDYGYSPLERYPFGTVLIAPCTFNTFNKIALGLADNLLTAMVADALGAGCRVVIAPAMNYGLWHHPQTHRSAEQLVSWGCTLVQPQIEGERVLMADLPTILTQLGIPAV